MCQCRLNTSDSCPPGKFGVRARTGRVKDQVAGTQTRQALSSGLQGACSTERRGEERREKRRRKEKRKEKRRKARKKYNMDRKKERARQRKGEHDRHKEKQKRWQGEQTGL